MFKNQRSGYAKLAAGIITSLLTLSLSVNVVNATSTNGTNINLRSEASVTSTNVMQIANSGVEVKYFKQVFL